MICETIGVYPLLTATVDCSALCESPVYTFTIKPPSSRSCSRLFLCVIGGPNVTKVLQKEEKYKTKMRNISLHHNIALIMLTRKLPGPKGQIWGTPPLYLYCRGQGVLLQGKHLALYSRGKNCHIH